jgi:hypothetical protein
LAQTVNALATVTVLSLSSQVKSSGKTQYFLVATTSTVGAALVPSGTVVYRENGRVIGSAKLKNGTAILALGRKGAPRGQFVAKFQGSARFGSSTSAPISAG